jgi:hypothetical protein
LLIGVIGHRAFDAQYRESLEREISEALDGIRSQTPNTRIVVVTSLAEGADRVGAQVAIAKGLAFVAPLPFEPAAYERDFPETAAKFRDLLTRAESAFVAAEAGFSGYEAAARWIARHCQIVIALWDGDDANPAIGGTAHTVRLRHQVGESGHTLSSVADFLGPVLHLHCPRNDCLNRREPRWIWPADADPGSASLRHLLSPLDAFNEEAKTIDGRLAQPNRLPGESNLSRAFSIADDLANARQKRFRYALKTSVVLTIIGYAIQQIWMTSSGRIASSLFLTVALLVIHLSIRSRNSDRYLEYRALAEVLRVAFFWQIAGVAAPPSERFLNQHWGSLRWIRSAVNALWIPDPSVVPDLRLVKSHWIDDQQNYYIKASAASNLAAHRAHWMADACFMASAILAWLGVINERWGSFTILASGILLLIVGAISHYAHTRGWEEDGARYRSMAMPFSWCQQIWQLGDEERRRMLVQELGGECVAELSNWLLIHRSRPIDLIRG